MQNITDKKAVYSRITTQIVEYLEESVRLWIRPWNAAHGVGRITVYVLMASPNPE
jgi:antirestriction protein ArdC